MPPKTYRFGMSCVWQYELSTPSFALTLMRGGIGTDAEAWRIIEDTRWRALATVCVVLGFDPVRPALRLMLRSLSGAIDEATVFWLEQRRPFAARALVDTVMGLAVAAFEGAALLDPTLDVKSAVVALRRARACTR